MRMYSCIVLCLMATGSLASRRLQGEAAAETPATPAAPATPATPAPSGAPTSIKQLYDKHYNEEYLAKNPKLKRNIEAAKNFKKAYVAGLDAAITTFKNRVKTNTAAPAPAAARLLTSSFPTYRK